MAKRILTLVLLFITFGAFLTVAAQNIEISLRYNIVDARYEVYALPDASNPNFMWGPSQLTLVVPNSVGDQPIVATSLNAGNWVDNTQAYADNDYHGFGSDGALVTLTTNSEVLLFYFVLPGECVDGLRIFENAADPSSTDLAMENKDFRNSVFTSAEAYQGNYNNGGTFCTIQQELPTMARPQKVLLILLVLGCIIGLVLPKIA